MDVVTTYDFIVLRIECWSCIWLVKLTINIRKTHLLVSPMSPGKGVSIETRTGSGGQTRALRQCDSHLKADVLSRAADAGGVFLERTGSVQLPRGLVWEEHQPAWWWPVHFGDGVSRDSRGQSAPA